MVQINNNKEKLSKSVKYGRNAKQIIGESTSLLIARNTVQTFQYNLKIKCRQKYTYSC